MTKNKIVEYQEYYEHKGIMFDEVVDIIDYLDCHDQEVRMRGYDKNNIEFEIVAFRSCGLIVEIEKDTLIKIG